MKLDAKQDAGEARPAFGAATEVPDVRWLAEYIEDTVVSFRIGTTGPELVAEWVGAARLVARRDGSALDLWFEPDLDPRDVEKIRRGSAWLLSRHLDAKLGLHGSSVMIDGNAVVFLGRSGEGKSTLAAALCERGAALLADDAVGVDREDSEASTTRFVVQPREVVHWLDGATLRALGRRPKRREGKEPISTRNAAQQGARLVAFVQLRFNDARRMSLSRRSGIEAVRGLVPQVARFVLDEPERQKWELDLLHTLVEAVPCYCLERPRGMEHLDSTAELIAKLLRAR